MRGAPEVVKAWPVGEVALSKHLYRHTQEVNAVTRRLIADHTKGFVQARELAMQIYEGYRFKDDPLKVKAKLPKYLREALRDPDIDGGFARLIAQIRVNELKTPALKAAYQQALDALEQGAGAARLKKLLRTAWYERNRYFANRIAQTELHRVYSNQVAQEIMADEATVWVKYQMSKTHPKVDICDRHAGLNGWGKGPGIYPKAQAPKPPAHPFCRCTVRPAYEVEGEPGKPVKDAEQRFMNRLSDYDQRLIAGSRDRLQQFRDGKPLEAIYNEGKNPIYRWGKIGDGIYNRQKLAQHAHMQSEHQLDTRCRGILMSMATMADTSGSIKDRFAGLWTSRSSHDKHLAKRKREHAVVTETDYAEHTFNVIAKSEYMVMVVAANDYATAKLQIEADGWIVLIGNDGKIVTSYRYMPDKTGFLERHREAGDIIHEYRIDEELRKILESVFNRP